ncbi:tRNA (5-methylaminomethyl-2-thiouridine)(34)-methyltransferase MnmD [Aestuariivivens insulae]|uniref:tRNA (5-methylaminomethyl-2-thiouridine)(34)-methyltransferase MnmD n=1 Tax=Aestuariivivens insulae TaxID=1621988 RepID=UPI001F57CB4F|nr:tRNA (5-methylaminomethyl-2-thiouridine)(34)-methyltransferase MnmD [Aestuariivivens insulae]
MKREIIITSDGSTTIHLPEWNEQYHSKHGAIQEAYHVFIKHGLHHYYHLNFNREEAISILEIGFGTGLNTLITLLEAGKLNTKVDYTGVEAYPVAIEEALKLNYTEMLEDHVDLDVFKTLHSVSWEAQHDITPAFSLIKQNKFFKDIDAKAQFNIIYFDAFGSRVQPDLWTEAIFQIMYDALKPSGVLVTYSAKGSVRRAMQSVGFAVEKLPGPPGKREMLRAYKEA